MIKDSFQTIKYKKGFILVNQWRNDATGRSGEEVRVCPFDGYGSIPCKSIRAAKIIITRAHNSIE